MKEVFLVFLWRNLLGVFNTPGDARRFIDTAADLTPGEREMCVIDRWPISD